MLGKLPLLLGWLLIAAAMGAAVMAALQLAHDKLSGITLIVFNEILIALMICIPFFHIWFLTGVFFKEALVALIVGTRSCFWLAAAIIRLAGGPNRQASNFKGGMLIGALEPTLYEFGKRLQKLNSVHGMLVIAAFSLLYLFDEAETAASTMLTVFLLANPVVMIIAAGISNVFLMTLPFVDEKFRAHTFLEAAVALIPTFMFVVLALYILYPGSITSMAFEVLGIGIPLYAVIASAAFLSFLLLAVAPYAWGVRAGKKQRTELLLQQKQSAAYVADMLLRAWNGDAKPLDLAVGHLRRKSASLDSKFPVIKRCAEVREMTAADADPPFPVEDIDEFRRRDPRLRLYDYVRETIANLEFAIAQQHPENNYVVQRQVLDHITLASLRMLSSTGDEIVGVERMRPVAFGRIIVMLGLVGSTTLSLMGKALLEGVVRLVKWAT